MSLTDHRRVQHAFWSKPACTVAMLLLAAPNSLAQPPQTIGQFSLSRPAVNAPPEATKPLLAWTVPEVAAGHKLLGYVVEVATDEGFTGNRQALEVAAAAQPSFTFREDLRPNTRYFWRIFAIAVPVSSSETLASCVASRRCSEARSVPENPERSFRTASAPFSTLERAGFTLQRTRDRATEGAQFAFSRKLSEKKTPDEERSTYTADFALIWDAREIYRTEDSRLFIVPQLYMEGKLNSQTNKAEDAWRFGGAAVMVSNFSDSNNLEDCPIIDGAYMTVGAKYESSQDFDTRKFVTDAMITPTSRLLGIGVPLPSTDCGRAGPADRAPVKLGWRPYFEVHYGRSIKPGASAEVKETVLRLVPRIRAELYLSFLKDALSVHQALLYAENTYYRLPLEDVAKSHNLLVGGFELSVTPNFGFGFIYKKGSSAPKFDYGNTFAGTLTVRFRKL